LALWSAVSWTTTGFMTGQIDLSVSSEITEIETGANLANSTQMAAIVEGLSEKSPDFFYLLEDSNQQKLAGNLPAMDPIPGPREWRNPVAGFHQARRLRGRGVLLPNNVYLFVGLDMFQLRVMRDWISHSFAWGLAITMVLALAAGVLTSMGLLRRVEQVSLASRAIMAGDFTRRLKLRGSYGEFDHLVTSLNLMFERIETLMNELQQVSTNIAHDLKTPLTRLRQRLERAEHESPAISACLQDVDQILETFSALLRIAQIETGARRAAFGPVDLSDALAIVVELYQPVAEENHQLLQCEIPPGLMVAGDRELLIQLFANLVENALRHTPPGTKISILSDTHGKNAEITVADTGPGIPAEARDRVTQRFYRMEVSRTTQGNGLGLAIAAAIAGLHGCELILKDHHPGLRASIILPLA
jgi:signal transduction histidine kinase